MLFKCCFASNCCIFAAAATELVKISLFVKMPKDGKYSYKMTQLTQSIWIACINVEFGMWLLFKVTPSFCCDKT